MVRVEAILFDMDGVLVDSEPAHEAATDEAARESGLGPIDAATFARYFFGRTDYAGYVDYLAARGRKDLDLGALLGRTAAAYARRFDDAVRPFPDGLETLRRARAAGYRVAIVSGARTAEIALVVARFALAPSLDLTVSGDDVPHGKPNPDPYLTAARYLGLEPGACLVVEDAPAGIAAARAAGMRSLAIDRLGAPQRLAAADRVVARISLTAIEELASATG